MIKPQLEGTYSDLSAMMVSSVRYALGRQTYIVGLTTEFIGDNLKILTDKDLYVMKRDIEESIESVYAQLMKINSIFINISKQLLRYW